MIRPVKEDLESQAVAWHLRLADASEDEWRAFADWLEADPRHNLVYEAICDADLALDPAVMLAQGEASGGEVAWHEIQSGARVDARADARARRRWMWPAMAASVGLAVAGTWSVMDRAGGEYAVVTAPGEARTLALSDGSRIIVNGGTSLVLDKDDPRRAELKSGEAQFTVAHDRASPFTLTVGQQRIVDVGTVFNVRSNSHGLQVEVAEGAVRYEDGVTRLRLNAGDTLSSSGDRLVEGAKDVADIGSWTRGKLVYRGAPLVEVAGDLARARGVTIELDPRLSQVGFTGVIQLDGDNAALRKRVELLIGTKVTETADGWSIAR